MSLRSSGLRLLRRPRERGDPYAVRSRLSSEVIAFIQYRRQGLWVPAFAGTTRHTFSFSRQLFARAYNFVRVLLLEEGAGKTGCALHPRSHVRCASKRMLHMSIQVQRKHSGLPCATALRLIRALPGDLAFLSPSPG